MAKLFKDADLLDVRKVENIKPFKCKMLDEKRYIMRVYFENMSLYIKF